VPAKSISPELETLVEAKGTLAGLGIPVLLSRAADPGGEVAILDLVSSTAVPSYDGNDAFKRLQLTIYAETRERTLLLSTHARQLLVQAGFTFLQQRANDPGWLSEFRRR
jgi:hypothetical protein